MQMDLYSREAQLSFILGEWEKQNIHSKTFNSLVWIQSCQLYKWQNFCTVLLMKLLPKLMILLNIDQMIKIMKNGLDIKIKRLGSYLIIMQFIQQKKPWNIWRKIKLIYILYTTILSNLASIKKYFSILNQRVLNKGISSLISQDSSKEKELIEQ